MFSFEHIKGCVFPTNGKSLSFTKKSNESHDKSHDNRQADVHMLMHVLLQQLAFDHNNGPSVELPLPSLYFDKSDLPETGGLACKT